MQHCLYCCTSCAFKQAPSLVVIQSPTVVQLVYLAFAFTDTRSSTVLFQARLYKLGCNVLYDAADFVHPACLTYSVNPLAPNDVYINRTAQLTSRRCILNIYSTYILTGYFKHAAHSPFFFCLQYALYFIMLPFLVPVIFTF